MHQAPGVNAAVKGDNDSGCGTDSEEDMEEEQDAPEEGMGAQAKQFYLFSGQIFN